LSLLTLFNSGSGTAFRSVQYGEGSQPYITVDINTGQIKLLREVPIISNIASVLSDINMNTDNLLSDAVDQVSMAAIDVNRIGNFLVDPQRGPAFLVQQTGLQLMNTAPNLGDTGTTSQTYDPLSALMQTALDGVGGHVDRTDTGLTSLIFGQVDTYEQLYKSQLSSEDRDSEDDDAPYSAILKLTNNIYNNDTILNKSILYSYLGGPNSLLGIGETNIYRYYNTPLEQSNKPLLARGFVQELPERSNGIINPRVPFNIIKTISPDSNTDTWTSDDNPIKYTNYSSGSVTLVAGTWKTLNRSYRVGSGAQDSINLTPIFSSSVDNTNIVTINGSTYTIEDLAKFRIEAINSDNPTGATNWMVFRAYITGITDSFNGEWNDIKYNGRGENFYVYAGFNRLFNISFKVAALSEAEMLPMWQKLNYLASNLTPDYASNGLMRGPFMRMTVGNYLYRQPCIISSLTYSIIDDAPWEISISNPGVDSKNRTKILYELPQIMEVNLSIIPVGIGRDGIMPQKGESQPFVLFRPHGKNDTNMPNVDNIWLTDYYMGGDATKPLVAQASSTNPSNLLVNGDE
jgi:hypothetical protein